MEFTVYILRCADGSYYTGHTDDLATRLGQHETGHFPTCYTFRRRPVELVWSQTCDSREAALAAELQIKGWSRKKKEALIKGDWKEISYLARGGRGVSGRAELVEARGATFDKLRLNGRAESAGPKASQSVRDETLKTRVPLFRSG